jgi:hypothetical protein
MADAGKYCEVGVLGSGDTMQGFANLHVQGPAPTSAPQPHEASTSFSAYTFRFQHAAMIDANMANEISAAKHGHD